MSEAVLLRSLVFVARGREAGYSLCEHRQTQHVAHAPSVTAGSPTGGYVNRVLSTAHARRRVSAANA